MTRVDIAPTEEIKSTQRVESQKNYTLGKIQTAYVGQPILQRKSYMLTIQDKFAGIPVMDISLSSPHMSFTLRQGAMYPASYQVEVDSQRFSAIEVNVDGKPYQILMDDKGMVTNKVLKPDNDVESLVVVRPINAQVRISRPGDVLRKDFQEFAELIYNGVSNNQLSITHREYNEDGSPRPEYFENLTYPANSEFIRFKSTKIKVHKADSEVFIYEVVSDE
jgi:hypothetical protein